MSYTWFSMLTHLKHLLSDAMQTIRKQSQQLHIEAKQYDEDVMFFEDTMDQLNRLSIRKPAVPPADIDPVYEAYMADR